MTTIITTALQKLSDGGKHHGAIGGLYAGALDVVKPGIFKRSEIELRGMIHDPQTDAAGKLIHHVEIAIIRWRGCKKTRGRREGELGSEEHSAGAACRAGSLAHQHVYNPL